MRVSRDGSGVAEAAPRVGSFFLRQKKMRERDYVISKPSPPAIEEERGRRRNGGGRACGANGGEQRCCCVEKIGAVASRMLVVNIAASSPLFPLGSHCRM